MENRFKMIFKSCPICGSVARYPMARSRKWRPLVGVRSYACQICHSQYISLFGLVSLLVERGFKPFYISESKDDPAIYSG